MSGFAATPRKVVDMSSLEAVGITPFILATPHPEEPPEILATPHSRADTFTITTPIATDAESFISSTSQTPLNNRRRMSHGVRGPNEVA